MTSGSHGTDMSSTFQTLISLLIPLPYANIGCNHPETCQLCTNGDPSNCQKAEIKNDGKICLSAPAPSADQTPCLSLEPLVPLGCPRGNRNKKTCMLCSTDDLDHMTVCRAAYVRIYTPKEQPTSYIRYICPLTGDGVCVNDGIMQR